MNELYSMPSVYGIFPKISDIYYKFLYKNDEIHCEEKEFQNIQEIYKDESIPEWVLKHSLGIDSGEEDLSNILVSSKKEYNHRLERNTVVNSSLLPGGKIRNLFYNGIKLSRKAGEYSHAVGPIHAGVIEPGHFRFKLKGEEILELHIRLGFQHRGILNLLKGKDPFTALQLMQNVSGDSSIAYLIATSELYEKAFELVPSDAVILTRLVLLELERVAIHIGDMGAIAGDVGYYPLLGLCSTDRGVPLNLLGALTGSRFGRYSIFPGEVRLNENLTEKKLMELASGLGKAFDRVEKEFIRMSHNSTARERLQECGKINREMIESNGIVGMPARAGGVNMDLRKSKKLYSAVYPLHLPMYDSEERGDAWARWYLRYTEIKNSVEWLMKMIPELHLSISSKGKHKIHKQKKIKPGLYFSAVEAWRGPCLVAFELDSNGRIETPYIRDASVSNWHGLEIAVRGELIGDFPLNNKSFNLSYVGFDL